MREATFIFKNRAKWQQLEDIVDGREEANADELSALYHTTNDDLSYAQTFFPEGESQAFLSPLLRKLHYMIYKKRAVDYAYFIDYFWTEVPSVIARRPLPFVSAFLIFILAFLVGYISSYYDSSFVRVVLGDAYVNKTLDNIASGDPLAIYKSTEATQMFFGITTNNIMVSFIAFIYGIFACLGTVSVLLNNGIMLGSFQTFILENVAMKDYILTVWLHGTLEISAIVLAGGAGMMLGASWLFPGDYSRFESFKVYGRAALKVIISLIPVFIMAGFIESFLTRHTEWEYFWRAIIVVVSAIFILTFYVVRPIIIFNRSTRN